MPDQIQEMTIYHLLNFFLSSHNVIMQSAVNLGGRKSIQTKVEKKFGLSVEIFFPNSSNPNRQPDDKISHHKDSQERKKHYLKRRRR